VVGCRDPFEAVAGRGIAKLREAGITVEEGCGARESGWVNRRFLTAHSEKRPYIVLKWAETADGFIARKDYSSKWISSEVSRNIVHQWRADEMAILVGARTARVDNPSLTVRHVAGSNPVRVVIDTKGSVSPESHLFDDAAETVVFTGRSQGPQGRTRWVQVESDRPVIPQVLTQLYRDGIISVLIEGGSETLRGFIQAGLWDEIRVFQSRVRFRAGIEAPSLANLPASSPHAAVPSGPDTLRVWAHPRLRDWAPTDWAVHAGIEATSDGAKN
jgi:diaminohydroxyphosphoribosylaminopyrimidine deaminase/5-amino-6-(5-phosphoribosylamino)uracil reductase